MLRINPSSCAIGAACRPARASSAAAPVTFGLSRLSRSSSLQSPLSKNLRILSTLSQRRLYSVAAPPSFSATSSSPHRREIRRPSTFHQLRHCSYRRSNMCKHNFTAEVVSSGVDISKGREVLPKNVKPLHYHLTLEPNLETFEYDGEVVIECVPPPGWSR
jgi:hypothetical protein